VPPPPGISVQVHSFCRRHSHLTVSELTTGAFSSRPHGGNSTFSLLFPYSFIYCHSFQMMTDYYDWSFLPYHSFGIHWPTFSHYRHTFISVQSTPGGLFWWLFVCQWPATEATPLFDTDLTGTPLYIFIWYRATAYHRYRLRLDTLPVHSLIVADTLSCRIKDVVTVMPHSLMTRRWHCSLADTVHYDSNYLDD